MSHGRSGVGLWLALVAGSLAGGRADAGDVAGVSSDLDAGAACKSPSDQGRGTKWSVAGEAVLRVGAAGSGAAEETDAKGGKTASPAWAGTAQGSERRTDGRAGYQGKREQALTFE